MPTLIELATQIVAAQASTAAMSTDDILSSLVRIHATMGQLEGSAAPGTDTVEAQQTQPIPITVMEAFQHDFVICMICGKKHQILTHHIKSAHGIKPSEYRKRFSIPKDQRLTSQGYYERHVKRLLLTGREQDTPKTEAPEPKALKAEAPQAEVPKADVQKAKALKAKASKEKTTRAKAPKAEAPKAEAPETEALKAEAPGTEALKAGEPGEAVRRRGRPKGSKTRKNLSVTDAQGAEAPVVPKKTRKSRTAPASAV